MHLESGDWFGVFTFFGIWLSFPNNCCREGKCRCCWLGFFFKIRQTNVCGCSSRMVSLKQPEFKSSRSVPHDEPRREKKPFITPKK